MLELVPIVEMVDFLDPLRQSIQCLLRLGIDHSGMLGRHSPHCFRGPAEAARRPAAPVTRALAPLQYPLDVRAAFDDPPFRVQPGCTHTMTQSGWGYRHIDGTPGVRAIGQPQASGSTSTGTVKPGVN
jgi:hypothetical protein